MKEAIKFLNNNSVQYFATLGLDGKPKVRPFQFMLEEDGKVYFCTSNKKDVFSEIKAHPYVELSTSSPEFAWIRLSGKAIFSNDKTIKNTIFDSSEIVQMVYKTSDNPDFEIFYLEDANVTIADFSGNPPKNYAL